MSKLNGQNQVSTSFDFSAESIDSVENDRFEGCGRNKLVNDRDSRDYYKKIARENPPFDRETEAALARQIEKTRQEKDEASCNDARKALSLGCSRLLYKLADRYSRGNEELFEELYNAGYFGLMTAIDQFDYKLGFRLATFATWYMKRSIKETLKFYNNAVAPESSNKILKSSKDAADLLRQEMRREPTVYEIAQRCGYSEQQIKRAQRYDVDRVSLDAELAAGDSEFCAVKNLSSNELPPVDIAIKHENDALAIDLLKKAFTMLPAREREIVKLYYGVGKNNAKKTKTYAEIGKQFNVSSERASQLCKRAIRLLRESLRDEELFSV